MDADRVMSVLGADTYKRSHTIAAVAAASGELLGEQTVAAGAKGAAVLLGWARGLGEERVWALEDCRHVSGSLERFLIGRGERVLRVHSTLMSASRRHARGRGKSTASTRSPSPGRRCANASTPCPRRIWTGLSSICGAVDHRERLVRQRVAINNTLQWHLHDLWPDCVPGQRAVSRHVGPADRAPARPRRAESSSDLVDRAVPLVAGPAVGSAA